MKSTIAAVLVLMAAGAGVARADIVDWGAADDGDGAIVCSALWDSPTLTLSIRGNQYWGPGHIGTESLSRTAFFQTDTELDPTVTLRSAIDNDTGLPWSGYHVNIYMNKLFSVANATVYTPLTSEPGWSGSVSVSSAVWNGSAYQAQLDFTGGTPIPDGGILDFSYQMSFTGSVQYCQEMTPVVVPEPGISALGLGGLVGMLVRRRRKA